MKYQSVTIQFRQGQVRQQVEKILSLCNQYGVIPDAFDWEITLRDGVADDRPVEYCFSTRDSNEILKSYHGKENIWGNVHFDSEKDVELFLQDQVGRLNKLLESLTQV